MKQLALSALVAVFILSATLYAVLTPDQARQAQALIAQFAARQFAARQKAVEDLIAMGPDVIPLVQQALDATDDAEVKLRCRMVLGRLKEDNKREANQTPTEITVPRVQADPVVWKAPEARPAFRELVPDGRYKTEAAAWMKKADVAALKKDTRPLYGVGITQVDEDTQASRLGIEAGDVLWALNDHRIDDFRTLNNLRERLYETQAGAQTLTVVKASGEKKTVSIERGLIGIHVTNVWRAPLRYVRSTKRDKRWDSDMLVAVSSFIDAPDVAETALCRAVKASYAPDLLTDVLGMCIASLQERHEDVLRFAHFALQDEPDAPETPLIHSTAYEAAKACYQFEASLRSASKCGWVQPAEVAELERLLTTHRALPEAQRVVLPPVYSSADMRRRDMFQNAQPLNQRADAFIEGAARNHSMHLNVEDDHFLPVVFGPAVKDIEIRARFLVRPPAAEPGHFARVMVVGLLDPESPDFQGSANNGMPDCDLSLVVWDLPGGPMVRLYHTAHVLERVNPRFPVLHADYQESNTLHVIVHGPHCEVYLNGLRVFYGPRPGASGKLVPCFKASGMEVLFEDLQVSELVAADAPPVDEQPANPDR